MPQMEPQEDNRGDVDRDEIPLVEGVVEVGVDVTFLERRDVDRQRGELQDVEDDESEQQEAGHHHRLRRERALDPPCRILRRAGFTVPFGQLDDAGYVDDQGKEQCTTNQPDDGRMGQKGLTEVAQPLGVPVDSGFSATTGTPQRIEVSGHMEKHVNEKDRAAEGDDHFLADR